MVSNTGRDTPVTAGGSLDDELPLDELPLDELDELDELDDEPLELLLLDLDGVEDE
jgi:hypothetical protein